MDRQLLAAYPALKSQLDRGRGLSHAYLISGPDAAARDDLARLLAAAMLCTGGGDKPCGGCPACRKVAAGIHPDLITVDLLPDKREILVEQARQMRADAWIRPNEGERKVYLIRNAHAMRVEAQNAILKLLEEGPAYAAFLLSADNPGALLPTIRSRCESLSLTSGARGEGEEVRAAALELLSLLAKGDELALWVWGSGLEKWDREALSDLFRCAAGLLRDALALAAGDTPNDLPGAVRAAAQLPPRKLMAAVDLLEELQGHARFNVGPGHLWGALCGGLSERLGENALC